MNISRKILIVEVVEDEAAERSALHDKLTRKGYAVLDAKDGEEGIEIALREHPDMILLDIRMPKMDGVTMMHKLREDEWGKKASIIILTNFDENNDRLLEVISDQPSYYLMKADTSLDQVLEKIQEVLKFKEESVKPLS